MTSEGGAASWLAQAKTSGQNLSLSTVSFSGRRMSPAAAASAPASRTEQASASYSFAGENDQDCIEQIKTMLSYLPSNNMEDPPRVDTGDSPTRLCPELEPYTEVDGEGKPEAYGYRWVSR
jgi:acetyl-CoA carboxylase carboxyltransferase component